MTDQLWGEVDIRVIDQRIGMGIGGMDTVVRVYHRQTGLLVEVPRVGSSQSYDREGALMILVQTQAERDAQIARLTAELFEMTHSRDEWHNDFRALEKTIVGDTGLSAMTVAVQARLFRQRAEKAEAERDAALARESALLASNQSNRELLYKLTGAQSEVIHMRNRFDTAVATARAEGRKDGLREAAAMCDDTAQEALEESGAESRAIWTWFRGQRDAILAAVEREAPVVNK